MKDLSLELSEIADNYDDLSRPGRSGGAGVSDPSATTPRTRPGALWIVVGAAVVLGAGLATFASFHRKAPAVVAPVSFEAMKMKRLSSSGNVQTAAISRDGRYLASVLKEKGRYGLWVKQVATGSDVRIVEPLANPVRGVTFSPDGNYVCFVNQETAGPGYSALYQVPVLGGAPRRLALHVDTAATFSPDGRKIAFIRMDPGKFESSLIVTNSDGTGELRLSVGRQPEDFPRMAPSWSPDGRRIAAFMMSRAGGWHAHVVTVDVSDGRREDVGDSRWLGFRDLTWVPDGSGLVLAGYGRTPPAQIWFVPYPAGPPRRVTNDLNGYVSASITADSKALATIQVNQESSLWVASAAHASDARQITPSGSGEPENYVVATANAILFTAAKDGYPYLWSIDYEGTGRVQVSPDRAWIMHADASRDDRTIVFDAIREDGLPHIWTIDRDTGRIIQLTQGGGEVNPSIAPDGTWFAYHIMAPDKASTGPALGPGIFTQRIAGGPPTRIDAAGFAEVVEVSADARRVAYYSMSEGKGGLSRRSLLVAAADGGGPLATLDWPAGFNARWAPSGDALTYVKERDGVGNLWSQPLDGSPSRPITSFTDLEIFSHDWTPDGKRLVLLRGRTTRDAVLISDFH